MKAALFDMDGLLIDTEAVYIEAYKEAAGAIGVDMPMTLCHAMIGVPTAECEVLIQDHFGPDFRVDHFQTSFRACAERILADHVPVKAGAPELLDFLASRGLPCAVATSSRPTTAERHLGRAGLLPRFAAIATRYDVARPKPHPDVYLEAARRLGVAPEHCLAFEDSSIGLTAAHAAGTMAIMVPDILQPSAEIRAKCVRVLPDLHAALGLLQSALR
ncbi:MAG: HAD family phosphatase [Reyranellaceae bacterium]